MDIGTAKISRSKMLVPHHLIDILDPGEAFSAQLFQSLSRSCFSDIQDRGKVPVLCGGTGLYVQSALEDMRFPKGNQEHNPVRVKYETVARRFGNQAVWDRLNEVDPASAALLHPNNVRRVNSGVRNARTGRFLCYSSQRNERASRSGSFGSFCS